MLSDIRISNSECVCVPNGIVTDVLLPIPHNPSRSFISFQFLSKVYALKQNSNL